MSPRRITALLTANVFQNGLSRHEESWRLYTNLLQRLSSESVSGGVQWSMSQLDYDLAFGLWDLYQLGGTIACQSACHQLQTLVHVCAIDAQILENSGCYRLNFYDAIRLACALDHNLDAIVTWEPRQFVLRDQELDELQQNGYFDIHLDTELAEDKTVAIQSVRVFSVPAFFIHLEHLQPQHAEEHQLGTFCLEKLKIDTDEEGNDIQATVTVRNPKNEVIQRVACSSTPCGAIYGAIDQCVDQDIFIPQRQLIRITIPDTLIEGVGAAVEVRISVECDRHIFRASAHSTNMFWALGKAYIDVINEICGSLKQV
ncbi:MAG TPA: alpha-isopropylmalate synthase regulatory domain-containing protein [Coleofasciculaceae cyanobacterium]